MEDKKVNIGWQRCGINEYLGIASCSKCFPLDHIGQTFRKRCLNSGATHLTRDCRELEFKCSALRLMIDVL